MNRHLLIIDPQNDFCDLTKGALPVSGGNGAHHDMYNLASMVDRICPSINQIHVTLDSHRTVDIAHPILWVNDKGEHPSPFTLISEEDVENGKWKSANLKWQQRVTRYVKMLKQRGRFPLVIWPPHCRIGTWGHSIYPILSDSLIKWEENVNVINFITKGSNIFTEHYGAFEAEVPDLSDSDTMINMKAIETIAPADEILVAGEALSHCVAETVRQLTRFVDPAKLTLLTDCCSNVTTFESLGEGFVNELVGKGMKTVKSTEVKI